ncbi:Protein byr4 [Fusarium oxysporum f. sp. albedinis]|nr:Protein byr4 [Fusarium oxysporum f. sp. albedinis]
MIDKIANWIFCIQLRSLRMINCCPLSSNSIRSRRIWRAMPAVPPQCSRDGSKHRNKDSILPTQTSKLVPICLGPKTLSLPLPISRSSSPKPEKTGH